MKRYIRIIIYLMILIMISNLISCTNTSGQQSLPTSKNESLSSSQIQSQLSSESSKPDISGKGDLWADKKLTIGVLGPGAEGTWRTVNIKDIMNKSKEWNIDMMFYDGQSKQELQIEQLEKLIEERVDVIGFMPVIRTGWDEILTKVKEAGIPLIFLDRPVEYLDESLWTTYIINDYYREGEMAGEWLVRYLQEQGLMDGEIIIAELQGTVGATSATERMAGFKEVVGHYDNLNIKYSQTGDFTTTKGQEVMEAFLKSDTDNKIRVVFSHNDDMAIGAINALKEFNIVPGKDVILINIESRRDILEAIVEGKIACSVECNPLMGDLFMEACVRLANGETIEREIHPVDRVFDITNAQVELDARKENGYGY